MEDQPACCWPTQNQSTKLRKGGPRRAMPLRLGKEIQAMLWPQLTGEFSLDATSPPRKVLHCLVDSEIRIDADPSRIRFSIRISTAGHRSHAPHWRSVSPVATLMISHKRKRWRPQPEALLGDKGYDTDSFIALKCAPSKPQHATERPRATFPGGLHLVCALAWLK